MRKLRLRAVKGLARSHTVGNDGVTSQTLVDLNPRLFSVSLKASKLAVPWSRHWVPPGRGRGPKPGSAGLGEVQGGVLAAALNPSIVCTCSLALRSRFRQLPVRDLQRFGAPPPPRAHGCTAGRRDSPRPAARPGFTAPRVVDSVLRSKSPSAPERGWEMWGPQFAEYWLCGLGQVTASLREVASHVKHA